MHQVWTHQSVDITELLLEYVRPLRFPDRLIDTTELPRPDRWDEARHRAQVIFEVRHDVRPGCWRHSQQQGAVYSALATACHAAGVADAVDSGDGRLAQCINERVGDCEPFVSEVESQVNQDVATVA